MRRTWLGMRCVVAVLFGIVGCHASPQKFKPPKHDQVYELPPDEARFSDPHYIYTKEDLSMDNKAKKDPDKMETPGSMRSPSRMGGGAGGPY